LLFDLAIDGLQRGQNFDLCLQLTVPPIKKNAPVGCISGAENLAAINRFSLNLFTPNQCLLI